MTEELEARMADFDRCVRERDEALAETVLHEQYALVLVQPSPAEMPRARWLAVLKDYVVHDYAIEEQRIDVDGDLAAVLQRVRMRATVLGEDRSGTLVISDVWRRGPGGWQVWKRHSTPFEAGRMPGA